MTVRSTTRFAINRLDMRSPSAFAASALLAEQLGPLIENPVTRHPAVIAGSIATLERLAPGRTWLGLGAGDTAVRLLGLQPARIAELEAATRLVRQLLAREGVEVGAAAPARLRHAAPVPVWIAAQGPRTLRMAGRVADGVFLRAGRAPAVLAHAIAQVRAGAAEAGRDPAEVKFSLVLHTVLDDDLERTDVVARAIAAGYHEYSPALFGLAGLRWNGPDVHALRQQVWPDFHHAADLHTAGQHVAFLGRDAMDAFALHGNAAQVRAQLSATLAVAGTLGVRFEIVVLHPVPVHPGRQDTAAVLERFAAELLLPLRHEIAT